MIDLGLSAERQAALLRALASGYTMRVEATLLTLDHKSLGGISGGVIGGQVIYDANATVTRQLQLQLVDPTRSIAVDNMDGTPKLNRLIRVYYCVFVRELGGFWVDIPVFTGPITMASRVGAELSIEALGKEHLALGPSWRSGTWEKGSNRLTVARQILRDLAGETVFQFPTGWTGRTSRKMSLSKNSPPWVHAKSVVKGGGNQIFYDGRGRARVRRRPIRPVYTFKDGKGGTILTPVTVAEREADLINTVSVKGAVPAGKKEPLEAEAYLPEWHPYSPKSLTRGGKERYIPEQIEDDTLRSLKEVKAVAERRISEVTTDSRLVTFDALPMPLLEEEDLFGVDAKDAKTESRLIQMTLPLTHSSPATYGYIAKASTRKRL